MVIIICLLYMCILLYTLHTTFFMLFFLVYIYISGNNIISDNHKISNKTVMIL